MTAPVSVSCSKQTKSLTQTGLRSISGIGTDRRALRRPSLTHDSAGIFQLPCRLGGTEFGDGALRGIKNTQRATVSLLRRRKAEEPIPCPERHISTLIDLYCLLAGRASSSRRLR
jgi:hypothetical protein